MSGFEIHKLDLYEDKEAVKTVNVGAGITQNAALPVVAAFQGTGNEFLFAMTLDQAIQLQQQLTNVVHQAIAHYGRPGGKGQ